MQSKVPLIAGISTDKWYDISPTEVTDAALNGPTFVDEFGGPLFDLGQMIMLIMEPMPSFPLIQVGTIHSLKDQNFTIDILVPKKRINISI